MHEHTYTYSMWKLHKTTYLIGDGTQETKHALSRSFNGIARVAADVARRDGDGVRMQTRFRFTNHILHEGNVVNGCAPNGATDLCQCATASKWNGSAMGRVQTLNRDLDASTVAYRQARARAATNEQAFLGKITHGDTVHCCVHGSFTRYDKKC